MILILLALYSKFMECNLQVFILLSSDVKSILYHTVYGMQQHSDCLKIVHKSINDTMPAFKIICHE